MNDWLLIANGEKIDDTVLIELAQNKRVLVCDGAYHQIMHASIPIHYLFGDFDSIDELALQKIRQQQILQVVDAGDQSATDLEKALLFADQQGAEHITIVNALGQRADHTIYNLRLLQRHHRPSRPIVLFGAHEKIFFCRNQTIQLHGQPGQRVSIFGFNKAILNSQGLKYDVTNHDLNNLQNDSISNELAQVCANLTILGDALLMIEHAVVID